MPKAKPVPDGFHTITPYLIVDNAGAAIDFYKNAFNAREIMRMPGPDGRVMHAELQIGDSRAMMAEASPQMGARSPKTLGGPGVSLFLYVEDVDAWFKRAVDTGAAVKMPVSDMFWGDRYGSVTDPFGHEWQLATHIEDLTPEEMGKRATAAMGQA